MKNVITTGMSALVFVSVAHAHPGHGSTAITSDQQSLWHYLTEPMHLGAGIVALASILVATRLIKAHSAPAR